MKNLYKFGLLLERFEKTNSTFFWTIVVCLAIFLNCDFSLLLNATPTNRFQINQICYEIRCGDQNQVPILNEQNLKKQNEKLLKQHFPDTVERVNYEKHQLKIYKQAKKRLKEFKRLKPLANSNECYNWLTTQEQTAFDYVHGRGMFQRYQDPSMRPNLYDTRITFLKKMENDDFRQNFLENWNLKNPLE